MDERKSESESKCKRQKSEYVLGQAVKAILAASGLLLILSIESFELLSAVVERTFLYILWVSPGRVATI